MDYKSIHNYMDDNFLLKDEALSAITYERRDTQYEITLIPAIGKADQEVKDLIRETVYGMIDEDWSHCVAGAYTIGNVENQPENIFVLIGQNGNIEFILNIMENKQIISHSWLFSKFDDPVVSTIVLDHISQLLSEFEETFIFVVGLDFSVFLKENYPYDNISENEVFRLEGDKRFDISSPENEEIIIFDGVRNNNRLHLLREAFDFKLPDDDIIEAIRMRHHVICIEKKSSEIMAKARINSFSEVHAVIGGVETMTNHRRKGLGFKVSYAITELVRNKTRYVVLETDIPNYPAIKIYEKIGFVKVGKSIFLDRGTNTIKEIQGEREY